MKLVFIFLFSVHYLNLQTHAVNKYSKDANVNFQKPNFDFEHDINVRTLDKPFRMAKLNLLWTKAQVRLTEPKLKSLLSELKIHDKEELTFKRIKSEGGDKDGLKEANMRKRLIGIMSTYGLLEHFEEVNDPSKYKPHKALSGSSDSHLNKSLFKDKKLNKLWEKAETSGFSAEELQALKEEFGHHQDKIDQYYSLLNEVEGKDNDIHVNSIDEKLDRFNEIDEKTEPENEESNHIEKANELRDKHRDIRDGFDRLHRLAVKGPKSNEFVEPKVQGLWKLATETNFTADELESLKVELAHYEKRLLKLRHLQVEAALAVESRKKAAGDKLSLRDVNDETIKKQARKVEKLHLDLEARIMQKHIEL